MAKPKKRASKGKPHYPKKSTVHIPVRNVLTPAQIEEVKNIVTEEIKAEQEAANIERTKNTLMLIAVSLNREHGFGHDRLCKLFDGILGLVLGEAPQDQEFWEHMRTCIEQLGLTEYFENISHGVK